MSLACVVRNWVQPTRRNYYRTKTWQHIRRPRILVTEDSDKRIMALTVSFKLCFSCFSLACHQQSLNPTKKKLTGPTKLFCKSPNLLSSRRLSGYSPNRASNSPREETSESSTINESSGVYLEDVNYLWKLGIGSTVGAALIKYGSILFPEITRPNLLEALIMISTPVIVAVVLLLRRSQE